MSAKLRNTSVWLDDNDLVMLRRTSWITRRSQSSLIREGIRILAREAMESQVAAQGAISPPPQKPKLVWLTHRQGEFVSLRNAGYSRAAVAEAFRITPQEVDQTYREIDEWIDALHRRHA